jgi:hypothetical protein
VAITPQVASAVAGQSATRKVEMRVRRPPSSRMIASARLPTKNEAPKSSKRMPPGPSSPASMPTTRKISRKGRPRRADRVLASTPRNNKTPDSSSRVLT